MEVLIDLFIEVTARLLFPSKSRNHARVRNSGCSLGAVALLLFAVAVISARFGASPIITIPLYGLAAVALLGFFLAGAISLITRSEDDSPSSRSP